MVYINDNKFNNINLDSNNFGVVIDFDATITTRGVNDSWNTLTNPSFINPNLSKDIAKLEEKYFPIELDYSIDEKTKFAYMEEWHLRTIDLFFEYGLTKDILSNCVKFSTLKLRMGAKNFFEELYNKGIPVFIISAGIRNVIVEFLRINDCYYDNMYIVGNNIEFENGKMVKFKDSILHSANKTIDILPAYLKENILNMDYILLFGDLITDINMIPKKLLSKTLCFGFLDKNIETNTEFYKNSFDVVLTDNASFDDAIGVLKKF